MEHYLISTLISIFGRCIYLKNTIRSTKEIFSKQPTILLVALLQNRYCTDYWSEQFNLNIIQAQTEVKHLIKERPQVLSFLQSLGMKQKNRVLITNSDRPSIELKFANSAIEPLLDRVISSHDYLAAKEDQQFWQHLQNNLDFNPQTTLFIDDSESVLDSAQQYGIKHLLSIKQPISNQPREDISKYPMVDDFISLIGDQTNG